MKKTLQEKFIESCGNPVKVSDNLVVQLDRISLRAGLVRIIIKSVSDGRQGVCLKTNKGDIFLSDGSKTKRLHIWNKPGLRSTIEHQVDCKNGELRIWNIYRITHKDGTVTEESWTNDAGMVVTEISKNKRHYSCSDGIGGFNPADFEFELEWVTNEATSAGEMPTQR